jgi:integrase
MGGCDIMGYLERIPEFIKWLKEYKSEATAEKYGEVLYEFRLLLQSKLIKPTPEDSILIYLKQKREDGVMVSTANYRRAVLMSFFSFIDKPIDQKKVPKIPENTKCMAEEDYVPYPTLKKLVDVADGIDKVMVTLLLTTGARLGEICLIKYGDFTQENDETISIELITLKGRKQAQRTLNISPEWAVKIIKAELDKKPSAGTMVWDGTPEKLRQRIYAVADKAGVKGVHPHTFRHALATYLLVDKQVSIIEVQKILGHADVSTTGIYGHANKEVLKRSMSKLD